MSGSFFTCADYFALLSKEPVGAEYLPSNNVSKQRQVRP